MAETLWDAYERYHCWLTAAPVGMVFPDYDDVNKRWLRPEDFAPWDKDAEDAWNTVLPGLLPPKVRAAVLGARERVAELATTDQGLALYEREMAEATLIAPGVYLASRAGAEDFDPAEAKKTVRICTEHTPAPLPAGDDMYADTVYVRGLDDAAPTLREPSLTRDQLTALVAAVERARDILRDGRILVHCSMGQSRSALFLVLLLMFTRRKAPSADDLAAWAMDLVGQNRRVVSIDPRWITLIIAAAQYWREDP